MIIKKFLDKLGPDSKDLIRGSGIAFGIRIFGIIALYLLTLLVTNNFGATVYGDFSYYILSLKLITLIVIGGVDVWLLRYVSENPTESISNKLNLQGSFNILVNGSLVVAFIILLNHFSLVTLFEEHIYYLAIAIIPFALLKINSHSYRAHKKILAFSILEYLLVPVICMLLIFYLLHTQNQNTNIPILAFSIATIAAGIISTFKWQLPNLGTLLSDFRKWSRGYEKTNKMAFPFLIAGSIFYISEWTVSVILKYFEGTDVFGIFDSALKIGLFLVLPLTATSVIAAPIFSQNFGQKDFNKLKSNLQLISRSMFFITLPMVLMVIFFSDFLMGLYGSDFEEGGNVLKIIALGFFFNALSGPVAVFLQMTENQSLVQNVFIVGTLLNICLTYLLVQFHGIYGAAISNLIFQIFVNGILLYYVYKKFGYLSFGK